MSARPWIASLTGLAAALACQSAATAQTPEGAHLPADQPVNVAGLQMACTGVGLAARQDPRWKAFSVRVEVSEKGGDYLGDATLEIDGASGHPMATVSCGSPWLLLGLPPGAYRLQIWSGKRGPKTVAVTAPAHGQAVIDVQFP